MPNIEVLSVAAEVWPLVKTGGVAEVAGALPRALAHENIAVRTLLPGYPGVIAALAQPTVVQALADLFGGPARLLDTRIQDLDLLVLDAPHLFDRPGNPYLDPDGRDWPDNALRFAALSRLAADLGVGSIPGYRPDVVHGHDWPTGLAAAYLAYDHRPRPATVFTVHDLQFQGLFPRGLLASLGLAEGAFTVDGVEFHGHVGFMKAGLRLADRITTVSPTYAREIRTPEGGRGLDGLLSTRAADTTGILNGIDTHLWNPATDTFLAQPFNAARFGGRPGNKIAIQERMGLTESDAPLFGVVSRLSRQTGLDLLLAALPMVVGEGAQLALVGSGDRDLEDGFRAAVAEFSGRVACRFGHDESLAHLIYGGADAILVPSRFEPCGLAQLRALRYGAVPLVARVGGLADSVIDANPAAIAAGVATGVQFAPVERSSLEAAIRRLIALFRQAEVWQTLQRNAMKADVSWRIAGRRYAELYRELLAPKT